MPTFAPDDFTALANTYASLQKRFDALAQAYALLPYKTKNGKEYATHGFLRRFSTMQHCVERVFRFIPPELDALPDQEALMDATIYIQAFVMNAFGALDNLAWIWVTEKPLNVGKMETGLGPKCKSVRASFTPETQAYLSELDDWFIHIVDFRDALAHRIALYIPPYIVPVENDAAYGDEYDRLKEEQLELVSFHPVMKHTLNDKKQPVVFHFQLLQDFLTVEEVARKVLAELARLGQPRT